MQTAIYCRVSTDKQEADNQLQELRAFCKRQKWEISGEYVDVISGGTNKSEREAMNKLFADAAKHKFDLVLFWSLDRFSREGVLPTLNYLNQLESYGVGFKSFTEQYLDSTGIFKDAVISILATVAKQEKIRISERTKAGLETARKKGKQIGRPKVDVDCEEIQRMRKSGFSLRRIAKELGVGLGTITRAVPKGCAEMQPQTA